jgi:catechol 2,3-dioxygenase-like lactoylglutathione lyase family enzyme
MKLNQVTVIARDYDASVAFYRALGLMQFVAAPPHYARFECADGAAFSLHLDEAGQPGATVVYFELDDLGGAVAPLKPEGLTFFQEPQEERWLWREARLRDPAGNVICLYHAGENRRFPPWRLQEPGG